MIPSDGDTHVHALVPENFAPLIHQVLQHLIDFFQPN